MPGPIVALLGATAAVATFGLPVETIGMRFGGIPTGLPTLQFPKFRADLILPLLPSAITVAHAGGDRKPALGGRRRQHDWGSAQPNAELVGSGTRQPRGAFVRRHSGDGRHRPNGDEHPRRRANAVAGIVHAFTLLAIVLVAAPLARYMPMATLAAILIVVAYRMGEWREIPDILRLAAPTCWCGSSRSR